ncbi:MAG: tyrosine-type recombinase/integrase [Dehalococcoidia bacterium]|nr:tyrosine-type recombinase/integrase [Dehalococcoidia bacterium]
MILKLSSIDFEARTIGVLGKGQAGREIELEKKGLEAVKNYLNARPQTLDDHLFLNKDGEPISERMVRKIVVMFKTRAVFLRSVHTP